MRMIVNESLRHRTTFHIDNTLHEICKKKSINFSRVLRSFFQFLFAIDRYHSEDINFICHNIIDEYKSTECIPLSEKTTLKNTHLTDAQNNAYQKIKKSDRKYIINNFISIAINNNTYSNIPTHNILPTLESPYVNSFTIEYFMESKNPDNIIWIMGSLVAKLNHAIEHSYISETYFVNLYSTIFSKSDSKDFINQYNEAIFLLKEFSKIYFCMLHHYNIKSNKVSSSSIARKVKKEYKKLFEKTHNKDIKSFLENEVNICRKLDYIDQVENFIFLLRELHPNHKEQYVINSQLKGL